MFLQESEETLSNVMILKDKFPNFMSIIVGNTKHKV